MCNNGLIVKSVGNYTQYKKKKAGTLIYYINFQSFIKKYSTMPGKRDYVKKILSIIAPLCVLYVGAVGAASSILYKGRSIRKKKLQKNIIQEN